MEETGIEDKSQFKPDAAGLQGRWELEIQAAKKNVESFHTDGDTVIKEYLGEGGGTRFNLYYADVQTKLAALGGEPEVKARRRFSDANDDVARISAEALERLLNTDIERDSDGFRTALKQARNDWQRPGLGQIRMRYVVEEAGEPCPTCGEEPLQECEDCGGTGEIEGVKSFEDVETDHVNWKDFLWSPCRTWTECRWVAYGVDMSREALRERFEDSLGDLVNLIPLNSKAVENDDDVDDVWSRARVWEIWDRENRQVIWFVEGFSRVLDVKPDPLGLPGFFPSPEPLAYNVTSSKYLPKAWFFMARDLYEEAHRLTERIRELVKAVKVVGAYSEGNDSLARVLDEACDNEMLPVRDLAALTGKGEIGGAMWFLPIEPQIVAITKLVEQRNVVRSEIAEVLGLSDIMRGQQAVRVTATTDRIKARAFSMRAQVEQDEYARFASEAQRIRAHIIAKHFDPATIIQRSNIDKSAPPELVAQAAQFLKEDIAAYRIDVDAQSLSMTDLDAEQQDSMAFMAATTQFFQGWTPLMQAGGPAVAKFALELFQAFSAGIKGADRFEGIVDRAVADIEAQAAQPKPPPPPDPRAIAEQAKAKSTVIKAQTDQAKAVMDLQATKAQTAATVTKAQSDIAVNQSKAQLRMVEAATRPPPMAGMNEESDLSEVED